MSRARVALRHHRPAAAQEEIDAALGLRRGEAPAEATEHALAIRERARLDAALQDTRELQATILVQQGETEQAVDEASSSTPRHLDASTPRRPSPAP